MPAILAGLADFAAATLAAMEAVAAFLLAVAALYMFTRIIKPLMDLVAHILPGGWSVFGVTVVPDLRAGWRSLEHGLHELLLDWRRGSEIEVAFTWHWMGQAWRWNAGMVEWLAKETDASFEWLARLHLPKWTKYAILAPLLPLLLPKVLRYVLAHVHTVIERRVKVIEKTLPGQTVTIVRKAGAVAIPGVWGIPGFTDVWHRILKRFGHINWRLSRLEKLLTVSGLAAVVATVLGVLPSCLKRNGSIGKAARNICGMDGNLLESILADTLAIASVLSVVEFANELRAIEDEAIGIMGALVREWPS